jgi:N-dimethylarginine dimethylaminohydrolase
MLLADQSRLTNRPSLGQAHFLMCPPRHFEVKYSINPWMDPGAWATKASCLADAADTQWQTLYETLVTRGAKVELVRAIPDLPDLVFTANAAVILDRKALLARFRHPERRLEEPVFARALHRLQSRAALKVVAELPRNLRLEGAGDCIWDGRRTHFWLGFGFRSDRASREVVADFFGVDCVALELADARFYHLDTAFCPLPFGEVIYYPAAFTGAARRAIDERVPRTQQIILDEHDATMFAANSVAFSRQILLSSCSEGLRRELEERGYTVIATPLHAFQRSGGSACCLTLRIDHLSARSADRRPSSFTAVV